MPNHPLLRYTHEFRVAYHQTDGQRRVHHSNYLNFFEDARVEMLRAAGIAYKDIEDSGRLLVVTQMNVQYHAAADFDDWLRIDVEVTKIRKVRLHHHYEVIRPSQQGSSQQGTGQQGTGQRNTGQRNTEQRIASADSTIACVGPDGRPKRLPEAFFALKNL